MAPDAIDEKSDTRHSLRWHYPGQVQRVFSQPESAPLVLTGTSTPNTLRNQEHFVQREGIIDIAAYIKPMLRQISVPGSLLTRFLKSSFLFC